MGGMIAPRGDCVQSTGHARPVGSRPRASTTTSISARPRSVSTSSEPPPLLPPPAHPLLLPPPETVPAGAGFAWIGNGAALFTAFVSLSAVNATLLVNVPAALRSTLASMVTLPPGMMEGNEHTSVVVPLQLPPNDAAAFRTV